MPWVKGQSGNPGGRPKEVADIRQLARQRGKEAIDTLYEIMRDKNAPANARQSAAVALLDRGYGRPEQSFSGALGVSYDISDKPLTAEEWARQYTEPAKH
jgi:uncharacterized protein (UPF0147 family)